MAIRPLLEQTTESEMHSIVTTGMATVAGFALAAYISFGVRTWLSNKPVAVPI